MVAKDLLPIVTELTIPVPPGQIDAAVQKVNHVLSSLEVQWLWKPSLDAGLMLARENVWSRAARRKQQQEHVNGDNAMQIDRRNNSDIEGKYDAVALAVKISRDNEGLLLRWLKGGDPVLFESFSGMLRRICEQPASS